MAKYFISHPGRSPDPMTKVRYSFEDELTFSPRLNSNSLKMASSVDRTSISERKHQVRKIFRDVCYFKKYAGISNDFS